MKKFLWFVVGLGLPIAAFAAVLFIREYVQIMPDTVWAELPGILCMTVLLFFGIFPVGAIGYGLFCFFSSEAVTTWFRLMANRLAARLQGKNSENIYPCLQQFLFEVLRKNKETLRLPVGQDATCLTPRGCSTSFRKNCVFFHFALIAPEKPDIDCNVLCQVVREYIWAELRNYGISGLSAGFSVNEQRTICTVFLDRVTYDEKLHLLGFDILYITSANSAQYALQAFQRDKDEVTPEREFCDDELG